MHTMLWNSEENKIIVKIYTLPEHNNNISGNFSQSICPNMFFKEIHFFMIWEMLIPSMTAVDDDLQKIS